MVSIERVKDIRTQRSVGEQPGGMFVLSGMAIAPVIRAAYPADTSDLIGAPDWVSSEIYDLTAKAAGQVPREQMEPMLRAMLSERFKLAVHSARRGERLRPAATEAAAVFRCLRRTSGS